MVKRTLQVEDGDFTRIVNPVIEKIIKIPFKGCELAVALFIIRKTWGFKKTEDEISLSQFCDGLGRSKQTIVTALKNLELVKVARLVKRGDSKNQSNVWKINKYIDTWELVKTARLVQRNRGTSLTEAPQLVQTARHTKDKQKKYTKETPVAKATVRNSNESKISSKLVNALKEFSPTGELDGDYKLDNLFPAKVVAKQIAKFIGKDSNNPEHHEEIVAQFKGLISRLNEFDRNKATKMSYIKYNFNSLAAKASKK